MESTSCNLCGAERPRLRHRKFDLNISTCETCGLVYAGPLRLSREETWTRYSPAYFHDEYLPSFGVTDGTFDLSAFDARYARTMGFIRPYRQRGTLLEVGSGAGFFLKAAERDGWSVMGLEVMSAGVEFSRTRLGLNVVPAAIEDAALPTEGYDIVAVFEVIEHLSDPKTMLGRIRALLRPGGCLAITTPNVAALSHRILGREWAVLSPAEHLYYFSETTLSAMLDQAGFVDVRFDRHYAGAGRYETMLPTHTHAPSVWRARMYANLVRRCGPFALRQIQALGLADGLHCLARRPEQEG